MILLIEILLGFAVIGTLYQAAKYVFNSIPVINLPEDRIKLYVGLGYLVVAIGLIWLFINIQNHVIIKKPKTYDKYIMVTLSTNKDEVIVSLEGFKDTTSIGKVIIKDSLSHLKDSSKEYRLELTK